VVVAAQTFSDLIRRLPTATVELFHTEGKLQVKYGKNRVSLQTFGEETLPEFPKVEGLPLTLDAETFARLGRELLFACSRDEARGVLRGVALTAGEGRLILESTDGSRFSHTWVPVPDFLAETQTVVFPAKAINEATRLSPEGQLKLRIGPKLAEISAGDLVLSTRLLDGVYPDLSHAAPEHYVVEARVPVSDFRGALERINLIAARDRLSSVRIHHFPGEGLELTASSQDVGNASERIDCESSGQELEILFNPQYLIEGLKAFTGEEALFELSGPQSAARLRDANDSSFFHAVLPMRQLVCCGSKRLPFVNFATLPRLN
jgi:DNA polymerase-3 subunit beta